MRFADAGLLEWVWLTPVTRGAARTVALMPTLRAWLPWCFPISQVPGVLGTALHCLLCLPLPSAPSLCPALMDI